MANHVTDGINKALSYPAAKAPVVVGAAAGLMLADGVYDFIDVFKEGKADNSQGPEFKLIWHGFAKVTVSALTLGALYASGARDFEKGLGTLAGLGSYFVARKMSGQNQNGKG